MEFLNQPELIVLYAVVGTAGVSGLLYGGYKLFSSADEDLAGDMLDIREATKDIELPKDDPMLLKGEATVDGPSATQVEADQPAVVADKPKKKAKKKTKKKVSKKKVARKPLAARVMTYMNKHEEMVKAATIAKHFREFSDQSVYGALNKLKKQGKLYSPQRGYYQVRKK